MATNININDNQGRTLTITSTNDTIDLGNDPAGTRMFKVDAPYTITPVLTRNPDYYTPGDANINGINHNAPTIMVCEHPGQSVEIHLRG